MKASSTKGRPRYKLFVKEDAPDIYRVAFVATRLRARRTRHNFVELISIDKDLPFCVTYNGHKFRPKIIIKIHRKFDPRKARKLASRPPPRLPARFV